MLKSRIYCSTPNIYIDMNKLKNQLSQPIMFLFIIYIKDQTMIDKEQTQKFIRSMSAFENITFAGTINTVTGNLFSSI
jgi:hypothetical protein